MSRSKRPRGVAAEPMSARQVREILQDLARWAVASSVGLAGGCSSVHELADMSQDVPEAGGGAGTGFPVSHAGRERPRAGTHGSRRASASITSRSSGFWTRISVRGSNMQDPGILHPQARAEKVVAEDEIQVRRTVRAARRSA